MVGSKVRISATSPNTNYPTSHNRGYRHSNPAVLMRAIMPVFTYRRTSMNINSIINQFIKTNARAYAKASAVFKAIESQDFASALADAGVMGKDIEVFATIYVAEATGVKPHPSQRDKSKLVFTKDTSEYNRVKYLVDVATGKREVRKQAKQSQPRLHITAEQRKIAKAYLGLFKSTEAAIKALRAVA